MASCSKPYTSILLVLLLSLGLGHSHTASSIIIKGACKPQGLLLLDKPYPPPTRVELPFCQQYGCSCCNASHALTLQRASRVIAEDEDLSKDCKLGLLRLTCRVCDPQVGTGLVKHICRDTCRRLYEACAQDFFAFDAGSGFVSPCSEQSGMLVCSQLTELVSSAADFCKAAGFGRIGDSAGDDPCFDGSPIGAEACPAESPGSKQQQQQQRNTQQQKHRQRPKSSRQQPTDLLSRLLSKLPWKLKRRHKRQLAVAAELFIGLAMSGFMAWAVVAVLQRVMKLNRHRQRRPTGPPPANVRDVLAKAAEARGKSGKLN